MRWHHVSQIHNDGYGWNDCAEASIARALLEYDPHTPSRAANANWHLVRSVADPTKMETVWDLISMLGQIARGHPDAKYQGITDGAGIQRMLEAFDLWSPHAYVDGAAAAWQAVVDNKLVLCWVDGVEQSPPSYPSYFFGGERGYDHVTLSLPPLNLYNDPLTIWPDTRSDVFYSAQSMEGALGGAWILPMPEELAAKQHIVAPHDGAATVGLKLAPNRICKSVATVNAGVAVQATGRVTPHWAEFTVQKYTGWLLKVDVAEK